jgi:hypothetical protein
VMHALGQTTLKLQSLSALGVTAASQLDFILWAPNEDLIGFAKSHMATAKEVLSRFGFNRSQIDGVQIGFEDPGSGVDLESRVSWIYTPSVVSIDVPSGTEYTFTDRDQALQLAALLFWLCSEGSPMALPHLPQYLVGVRLQLAQIWWRLLVVPELEQAGISAHQQTKARRGRKEVPGGGMHPDTMKAYAQELKDKGLTRPRARGCLEEAAGIGVRRANQILSDIGWAGGRRRAK